MRRHKFCGGRLPFTLSAALTIKSRMIFWHRLRCLGLEAKMASAKCGLALFPNWAPWIFWLAWLSGRLSFFGMTPARCSTFLGSSCSGTSWRYFRHSIEGCRRRVPDRDPTAQGQHQAESERNEIGPTRLLWACTTTQPISEFEDDRPSQRCMRWRRGRRYGPGTLRRTVCWESERVRPYDRPWQASPILPHARADRKAGLPRLPVGRLPLSTTIVVLLAQILLPPRIIRLLPLLPPSGDIKRISSCKVGGWSSLSVSCAELIPFWGGGGRGKISP